MNIRQRNSGFTLVELLVVVVIVGVLFAVQFVFAGENRKQASVRADIAKLRLIGQASAMYAEDNKQRLFSFTWRPGELPDTPNTKLALACASLSPFVSSGESKAAVLQQLDLVTRGFEHELLPPDPDVASTNHTPYPSYNHLVLAHYMGEQFPSEIFISGADRARNSWRDNIDKFLEKPLGGAFRPPSTATSFNNLWRWSFGSSFAVGVSHYSNDTGSVGGAPRTAERATTHRTWYMPTSTGVLGNRRSFEAAHPSAKVMMFDKFDRYTGQGQFGMLNDSKPTMNFYDGHAARNATDQANYGFFPNNPSSGADTPDQFSKTYWYSPISWWDPPGSVSAVVAARYDQTRDGLQGVDYSGRPSRRLVEGRLAP